LEGNWHYPNTEATFFGLVAKVYRLQRSKRIKDDAELTFYAITFISLLGTFFAEKQLPTFHSARERAHARMARSQLPDEFSEFSELAMHNDLMDFFYMVCFKFSSSSMSS
jgi:hypothetical protein